MSSQIAMSFVVNMITTTTAYFKGFLHHFGYPNNNQRLGEDSRLAPDENIAGENHRPPTPNHPSSRYLPSLRLPSESSGSYSTLDSSKLPPPPPAQSAVDDTTTVPPLLTQELMDVGEKVWSNYDLIRVQHCHITHELQPFTSNPFSSLTIEQLEKHYAIAIDTRDTLQLRKAAVATDIGDSLRLLLPKISLYNRDGASLTTVLDDLRLISEACVSRRIKLDTYGLEHLRYRFLKLPPSVTEEHDVLFSNLKHMLHQKIDVQQVAQCFKQDPSALIEHRLHCSNVQR